MLIVITNVGDTRGKEVMPMRGRVPSAWVRNASDRTPYSGNEADHLTREPTTWSHGHDNAQRSGAGWVRVG